MFDNELTGSHLARAMLDQGNEKVWCAVADNSDEEAIQGLANNDFTDVVVSFSESGFYCTSGIEWAFAVPIKITVLTEDEANLF